MSVIPMFVYGTLRPGGELHHLLTGGREGIITRPAMLPGQLFYHPDAPPGSDFAYPVAVPGGLSSYYEVSGDLVQVDTNWRQVKEVIRMEVLAGYDARWLDTYTADNFAVNALMFTWPGEPGQIIESGDWLNREETA